MNKKILLTAALGAVAMFLWTFVAHMALPLGEAGVLQIDHEQPLLDQMKTTLPGSGLYLFPAMAPGETQAQYQQKTAAGPSGILVYLPSRSFSFGAALAIEFLTEFIQAWIAVYLLTRTRIASFPGRLGFIALVGFAAAIATNVSYWNWYAFPAVYSISYIVTSWMGYVCVGVVAGFLKPAGAQTSAA